MAPSAQFTPTHSGLACATEVQNASMVCPDSVRPDLSVMVTEMMVGTSSAVSPRASSSSAMATSAAPVAPSRLLSPTQPVATAAAAVVLYARGIDNRSDGDVN